MTPRLAPRRSMPESNFQSSLPVAASSAIDAALRRVGVEHAVDDDGAGLQSAGAVLRVVGPGHRRVASTFARLICLSVEWPHTFGVPP